MRLRRKLCSVALGALTLAVVVPATATATPADVELVPDGMVIGAPNYAVDSTPHNATVSFSGGSYTVTDSAGIGTVSAACTKVNATTATCPEGGIRQIGLSGGAGADHLTLASVGPAADAQTLSITSPTVYGWGGNDTISDGPTASRLFGQDGNDFFDGGFGSDSISGGKGTDTASYAGRTAAQPIFVNIETASLFPGAPLISDGGAGESDFLDIENVIGGAGNDIIIGPKSSAGTQDDSDLGGGGAGPNNVFTGGAGNDRLVGNSGNDKLLGGAGRDSCNGGPAKDKAKSCEKKRKIP